MIIRKLALDRAIAFDPPKSEAQRRLMEAAAHTPGGYGGVSQKVGKEFVGDAAQLATAPNAAGIQFRAPNGHALFLKRSKKAKDHAGTWCWPGGGIEGDETPEAAAARETAEETGYTPEEGFQAIDQQTDGEVSFKTFGKSVDQAFIPALDEEHVAYAWAPLNDPPEPLHPGVAKTIALQMQKALGNDAAIHNELVREIDSPTKGENGLFVQPKETGPARELIENHNRERFANHFKFADPYTGNTRTYDEEGRYNCGRCNQANGSNCLLVKIKRIDRDAGSCGDWENLCAGDPEMTLGEKSIDAASYGIAENGIGFGCHRCPFASAAVEPDSRGRDLYCGKGDFRTMGDACCAINGAKTLPIDDNGIPSGKTAKDHYAFDRASVRKIDPDNGHMHVATTNISKANVCPYLGKEIPDAEALGLDPEKIYYLYRDPEELAKAAPSFNNLPLLRRHIENTADNHNTEDVIGSTGTDATFKHPYLQNSLVIWDQPYIDAVEDESQKELSSAYRYRADMSPGVSPQGEKYDGVMRDIKGNHVALVKEGRAGSDVVVGDSKEVLNMKHALSLKAVMARGALAAFLAPKLAQDTAIPLTTILGGVTAKNFKEMKPKLLKSLNEALKGKLAKDEKADGLAALLDALESTPVMDDADPMEDATFDKDDLNAGVNPLDDGHDDPAKGEDDENEALKKYLSGILSPEQMAEVEKLCNPESAMDDPTPFGGMPKPGGNMVGKKEPGAKDKEPDMVSKEDAQKMAKGAEDAAIARSQEIRAAEKLVAPYVGEMAKSYGSAAETIRHALMAMDVKGVEKIDDVNALTIILQQQKKPGEKEAPKKSEFAMDAKAATSFAERHPGASRIQIA